MKEKKFDHMLYLKSIFVGLFFVILISTLVVEPLIQNIKSDIVYSIIHIMFSYLILYVFMKSTIKQFTKVGIFNLSKDNLNIKLNKKEYNYNLSDIKEVICFKTNFIGFRYVILEIRVKGSKIKIFSKPSFEKFEIEKQDLYSIYEILKDTNYFNENKEYIYHLKRK